jgi:hypothetical protein
MRKGQLNAWPMLAVLLVLPGIALSQTGQQILTLVVSARPGTAKVVQVDGRSYVDIEGLARVANGTLGFTGNQIVLTLPVATVGAAATIEPAKQGFSKEFLRADIEEMAAIREWRSVVTSAVRYGYPVREEWLSGYHDDAVKNLTLASVAASSDTDRDALKLLTNKFDNMQKLNDEILELAKSRDYIPPDILTNDPLDQRILNCAHSLASMAADGQIQDDGTCH